MQENNLINETNTEEKENSRIITLDYEPAKKEFIDLDDIPIEKNKKEETNSSDVFEKKEQSGNITF